MKQVDVGKYQKPAQEAFRRAFTLARVLGHHLVDVEHLFVGCGELVKTTSFEIDYKDIDQKLKQKRKVIGRYKIKLSPKLEKELKFLEDSREATLISIDDLVVLTQQLLKELKTQSPEHNEAKNWENDLAKAPSSSKMHASLSSCTINLTELCRLHKLEPVIGREHEIKRMSEILCRKKKNNPLLLGSAGVGKTAIVEGFAQKIVEKKVPKELWETEILSFDLTGFLSDTKFRGQFEEKTKQLIEHLKKFQRKVILFIDEIHMIFGAGSQEGLGDLANHLKPALARGEITCIGATTFEEFKKFMEKDQAFVRRFQDITIDELTSAQTVELLNSLKKTFEDFHGVKISPDAIKKAVLLSEKYLLNKKFPDKALDLIDEAFSKAKHKNENSKEKLVLEEDILSALAGMLNIPQAQLSAEHFNSIAQAEETLNLHVFGQTEAVHEVAKVLKRAKINLNDEFRPLASFLFLGPTGVGKTELSKAASKLFYGDFSRLIRFDMSEFHEAHTVSRLLGSPPGYVGYGDSGEIIDQVRRQPYSGILFDEIEKAHPKVFDSFLQILDEGHLTSSNGKKAHFKNSLIFFTSNYPVYSRLTDFQQKDSDIRNQLTQIFRKEFLARLDAIVLFNSVGENELQRILDRQIANFNQKISENGFMLDIGDKLREKIFSQAKMFDEGARALKRIFTKEVIDFVVSEFFLKNKIPSGLVILNFDPISKKTYFTKTKDDSILLLGPPKAI